MSIKDQLAAATRRGIDGINYFSYYNSHPHHATTYRGRVLLSAKIIEHKNAPESQNVQAKVPFRLKVKKTKRAKKPLVEQCVLSALVYSGVQMPKGMGSDKYQIKIACGRYECETDAKSAQEGTVDFYELLTTAKHEEMNYPKDADQIPDVFVYLVRDKQAICFARFPAKELMYDKDGAYVGFPAKPEPKWINFEEDKSLDALNSGTYPGSLLIALSFGRKDDWEGDMAEWQAAEDERTPNYPTTQPPTHAHTHTHPHTPE